MIGKYAQSLWAKVMGRKTTAPRAAAKASKKPKKKPTKPPARTQNKTVAKASTTKHPAPRGMWPHRIIMLPESDPSFVAYKAELALLREAFEAAEREFIEKAEAWALSAAV